MHARAVHIAMFVECLQDVNFFQAVLTQIVTANSQPSAE